MTHDLFGIMLCQLKFIITQSLLDTFYSSEKIIMLILEMNHNQKLLKISQY